MHPTLKGALLLFLCFLSFSFCLHLLLAPISGLLLLVYNDNVPARHLPAHKNTQRKRWAKGRGTHSALRESLNRLSVTTGAAVKPRCSDAVLLTGPLRCHYASFKTKADHNKGWHSDPEKWAKNPAGRVQDRVDRRVREFSKTLPSEETLNIYEFRY